MDREAWQATVHGGANSLTERLTHTLGRNCLCFLCPRMFLRQEFIFASKTPSGLDGKF